MHFSEYIQASAHEIEQELEHELVAWRGQISARTPSLIPLVEAFISSSSGGKRIRGALVRLGFELAGGEDLSAILPASVALEVFQTAILAHDDIIDKSEKRRGRPSLYTALGGDHYAISQTISLGDFGFFKANELITRTNVSPTDQVKAITFFNNSMLNTAEGEMLDVYLPTIKEYQEKDILALSSLKTASYTFICPLGLGVILGGGSDELIGKIREFGENLGIAYQLHDDWLGIFGQEEELGKSTSSDIKEGKVTLLFSYAHTHADSTEMQHLTQLYGNHTVTPMDVETVRSIFLTTGASEYVLQTIQKYIHRAREQIAEITQDESMRELLESMTEYLIGRKK